MVEEVPEKELLEDHKRRGDAGLKVRVVLWLAFLLQLLLSPSHTCCARPPVDLSPCFPLLQRRFVVPAEHTSPIGTWLMDWLLRMSSSAGRNAAKRKEGQDHQLPERDAPPGPSFLLLCLPLA